MSARPLLLTAGEPAGVGPELAIAAAAGSADLVVVADPELLEAAAARYARRVAIVDWQPGRPPAEPRPGQVRCLPVSLEMPSEPGRLDPRNARYVLDTLDRAADAVRDGEAAALVTGPVHKGVINDAGIAFTGHTEYLAARAGVDRVVMMLVAESLRVALATTHLPLRAVPDAIRPDDLARTIEILHADLVDRFGIAQPVVAVLGLNPHAGEGGHLGREEIDVIAPTLERLRARGMDLRGPLPADTALVPAHLGGFDAVLAMYHDQGLPVLKYAGFGHAVNVTLGLPFIRTSVDHGTALDIAGTGRADSGSLRAAVALARRLAGRRVRPRAGTGG